MKSLSELYRDLTGETTESQFGLYQVTNTPWVAENTPDDPIIFNVDDYTSLVTVTMGSPSNPMKVTWPHKIFCKNSLFFRSICMPRVPTVPDTTPNYIRILRKKFTSTATIPFPCTTKQQCDAFSIFLSWNTHGELKQAKQFAGITTEDVYYRPKQYMRLWDQMLECYKLSQFLVAPKFANKVMDTMIYAIQEEASYQTKRRRVEDDNHDHVRAHPSMPNEEHEYRHSMDSLKRREYHQNEKMSAKASAWLVDGTPSFTAWNELSLEERLEILRLPLLPPDMRHILGATPKQITQLYADTNPRSQVRKMMLDMIISYSVRFPKYYGQNPGFGALLGGSEQGSEGELRVPMEFVRDLLARFSRIGTGSRGGRYGEKVDLCKYHDHRHGATCPRRVPVARVPTLVMPVSLAQEQAEAADALVSLSGDVDAIPDEVMPMYDWTGP